MRFAENVFPKSASVDGDGTLSINGVGISKIAEQFSTPTIVYSAKDIADTTDEFVDLFDQVLYASKAAPIIGLERLIFSRGAGCDVASAGELEVALRAGCDIKKIVAHGNLKSSEYLSRCVESRIGRIVIEDEDECSRIEDLAKQLGIEKVNVQIRLTPGIEAHTHEYLKTGAIDSKFGNPIEYNMAAKVCDRVINSGILVLKGLHCHIGSQIFDTEPLAQAARVTVDFFAQLRDSYREQNIELKISEVNLGGGFGIHYSPDDDPPAPIEMAKAVRNAAHETCELHGIDDLEIWVEPGRALVGQAGFTIYKVGHIKKIPEVRKYVAVDGGMSDNVRPTMYGAKHLCWINSRNGGHGTEIVTVAGLHCEEGDILAKDVELPDDVESGDLLLMASTGAYSYAMQSNYNMIPRPSVVLIDSDGTAQEIVRRETVDEMLTRQI